MARFELKFLDCFDDTNIEVIAFNKKSGETASNEDYFLPKTHIAISINAIEDTERITIILDKSTAIKYAKTLRTEINKITESEVYNG